MPFILALDQGTSSSRSIIFNEKGHIVSSAQKEFNQIYPQPGWMEHDAEEIWETQLTTAKEALKKASLSAKYISAVGITNQRETIVIWDRKSGRPVSRAIVWQDRRTSKRIAELKQQGHEPMVRKKTGLLLDPYFSASKLEWLLGHEKGIREKAERGLLAAGTIDSWLLYKLTGNQVHATDITNASRTLLFNIHTGTWDQDLQKLFSVPFSLLPHVMPSSGQFGTCDETLFGEAIPITGMAGDQQAALFGQQCFEPGMAKNTFGTGCFLVANTGAEPVIGSHNLLATVAWKIGKEPPVYALEGSIFTAGAAIQWLRDGLGIIDTAPDINTLASEVTDSGGVYMVPAFAGLGAPHWDSDARGTILGITRGTTRAHIARATLEGIAYQVAEVFNLMESETGTPISSLRVDGGASASDLLMQIEADIIGVPIARPPMIETTALGAALLAGLGGGIFKSKEEIQAQTEPPQVFSPRSTREARADKVKNWQRAVERAKQWA